eukprot:1273440-Alexandrium_andersonii.AAC.1
MSASLVGSEMCIRDRCCPCGMFQGFGATFAILARALCGRLRPRAVWNRTQERSAHRRTT